MEGRNIGKDCQKCGHIRRENDGPPYEECPICCTNYVEFEAALARLRKPAPPPVVPKASAPAKIATPPAKPKPNRRHRYCRQCGHVGVPKLFTPGSILIELVMWICFIAPGLIYSIWRHTARRKVCALCGAREIVPLNSPIARKALAEENGMH